MKILKRISDKKADPGIVDVCLVSPHFYPTPAGAAERFRRYATGLRERGIQLRIITQQKDHLLKSDLEALDELSILRIPAPVERAKVGPLLIKKSLLYFYKTKRYPDVFQIFNSCWRSLPFLILVRHLGIPCLSVSTIIKKSLTNEHKLGKRLKDRIFLWLSYRPFNCVIVSSDEIRENLLAVGASPNNAHVIPNGVDLLRFKPLDSIRERDTIRSHLGFGPEDKIILFVGTISPRKGVHYLIEAWPLISEGCNQARLLLVGALKLNVPKIRRYYDSLKEIILKSSQPQNVTFVDHMPNIEEYYQIADIFVFPSLREGWGNAVAEAMATALPCIITPFEGLSKNFGEPDREFILVKHDSEDIAVSTMELLNNQEYRQQLGKTARFWVEDHLSLEKSLDQYENLYRKLSKKS